jgi:hypothetical protein
MTHTCKKKIQCTSKDKGSATDIVAHGQGQLAFGTPGLIKELRGQLVLYQKIHKEATKKFNKLCQHLIVVFSSDDTPPELQYHTTNSGN